MIANLEYYDLRFMSANCNWGSYEKRVILLYSIRSDLQIIILVDIQDTEIVNKMIL